VCVRVCVCVDVGVCVSVYMLGREIDARSIKGQRGCGCVDLDVCVYVCMCTCIYAGGEKDAR